MGNLGIVRGTLTLIKTSASGDDKPPSPNNSKLSKTQLQLRPYNKALLNIFWNVNKHWLFSRQLFSSIHMPKTNCACTAVRVNVTSLLSVHFVSIIVSKRNSAAGWKNYAPSMWEEWNNWLNLYWRTNQYARSVQLPLFWCWLADGQLRLEILCLLIFSLTITLTFLRREWVDTFEVCI